MLACQILRAWVRAGLHFFEGWCCCWWLTVVFDKICGGYRLIFLEICTNNIAVLLRKTFRVDTYSILNRPFASQVSMCSLDVLNLKGGLWAIIWLYQLLMKPLYLSIFIINLVLSSYVLLASIPLVGANSLTDFDTPPSNLLRGENLHLIKLCPLNLLVSLL